MARAPVSRPAAAGARGPGGSADPAASIQARSGRRVQIDDARGELGQLLVRRLLLVERAAEDLLVAAAAQQLGVGADGAVAGDLVVLDALGRGDQAGVADVRIGLRVDDLLAFLDQPGHRLALVAGRAPAERGVDRL